MSLARKIQRLLRRNEQAAARRHRNKAIFEPLEPRLLLSADLKLVTTGGANDADLPLQKTESGDIVKLADNADV